MIFQTFYKVLFFVSPKFGHFWSLFSPRLKNRETDKLEFEYKLSGGLPDGNIPALINHVRTFLGEKELIELVRYTFVVFGLADCGVNA